MGKEKLAKFSASKKACTSSRIFSVLLAMVTLTVILQVGSGLSGDRRQ